MGASHNLWARGQCVGARGQCLGATSYRKTSRSEGCVTPIHPVQVVCCSQVNGSGRHQLLEPRCCIADFFDGHIFCVFCTKGLVCELEISKLN